MAIDIQQFQDDQILINNKLVVQDSDGRWIAKIELTTQEQKALNWKIKEKREVGN